MKHRLFGRKLNRSANERKRLFKNLTRSLILNGNINTTFAKAKSIQPSIEKLITKAKENTLANKRVILKELADTAVTDRLLKDIAPLFKGRQGGYTRIVKLTKRFGDNSSLVSLSFVENVKNSAVVVKEKKPVKKEDKKVSERTENAKNKTNKK